MKTADKSWIYRCFYPWQHALSSLLILAFALLLIYHGLSWALFVAEWSVISDNLYLLLFGIYPPHLVWRAVIGVGLSLFALGLVLFRFCPSIRLNLRFFTIGIIFLALLYSATLSHIFIYLIVWLLFVALTYCFHYLLSKSWAASKVFMLFLAVNALAIVSIIGFAAKGVWTFLGPGILSGFLLSYLLSIFSILLSFPIGLILALSRQSQLYLIQKVSVIFIECVRGIPLITVLFTMQVMFPLFLPDYIEVDRVMRALYGLVFFSSAYLAEDIRGGLQSISKGQYEAADALGMNYFQKTSYIILPQALKKVVPIIAGRFISLFKDTSLVAVVGMLDLIGVAQSVISNPDYLGRQNEVYLFIALIYWLCSFLMSKLSKKMEQTAKPGVNELCKTP
ncbi:MAG: ABC transporter permease subunit [Chlamydiales bacterium]|nr:amino acid ABC transporter permease [Chlamydiales bacterium]NCF70500.1 ABC transporter permease subunit [Chlamydiales bacterium]